LSGLGNKGLFNFRISLTKLCPYHYFDSDSLMLQSTNTATLHITFVFIVLVYSTSDLANIMSHLQSFADRRLTSPLGKSTVADNSTDNMRRYQKECAFHRLHCFTMFLEYLQLKQVQEGIEICCFFIHNLKLSASEQFWTGS
jgi:hypothetical protein